MSRQFSHAEPLFPLKNAADYLPRRGGKKTHYSTLYRWATKGTRGRILESTMVGGVRYTSIAALERFMAARTQSPRPAEDALVDAVQRALDDAGL
ncbi:DUF1580 domain-containing protein [Adhaeretor mobilis]|uniref:Uncharacterized protein n=1 Tax=Adhaeretor mobilis TaxID=1930276 RepID=A0A517MWN2_9BACT|nr:DUF1580 domain-containing protein [Adhaeretor mobilis]QDS99284.1 hypothetical protein HG15A2_26060 [Adhaeretor mobilis]